MRTKKRKYTEFLPPTPCTSGMKEDLTAYASESGISLAEAIRSAVGLFLAENDTKSIGNSIKSIGEGETA